MWQREKEDSSSSSLLLLCDEELLITPSPCSSTPKTTSPVQLIRFLPPVGTPLWDDSAFQDCIEREQIYRPGQGYMKHLEKSTELSNSRFRAVQWILLARSRLNLAYGTAFNAVNHVDRFISSTHSIKWEGWMVELLSITCLFIASKLDEVSIPSLHDLQMEDLDHSFQQSTIERMELVVLKALNWRLSCVTAYSYVELLTWRLDSTHALLTARVTDLLLGALLDAKFLKYSACTIAASALKCGIGELVPLESDADLSILERLIPVEEMEECYKNMEEHTSLSRLGVRVTKKDKCNSSLSPVTVIPLQRTKISDRHVDIDNFLKVSQTNSNAKKLKRSLPKTKRKPKRSTNGSSRQADTSGQLDHRFIVNG